MESLAQLIVELGFQIWIFGHSSSCSYSMQNFHSFMFNLWIAHFCPLFLTWVVSHVNFVRVDAVQVFFFFLLLCFFFLSFLLFPVGMLSMIRSSVIDLLSWIRWYLLLKFSTLDMVRSNSTFNSYYCGHYLSDSYISLFLTFVFTAVHSSDSVFWLVSL